MKNYLFFVILCLVLVSGCGQKEESRAGVHALMEEYPEVKQELKDVPEKVLERIIVPKYMPFEVKNVKAVVYPGDRSEVELIFSNGDINLHVLSTTLSNENIPANTKINEDHPALYDINTFGRVLRWPDKKHNGYYTVKLMSYSPDQGLPYTKRDLLKVANSMYQEVNTSM